MSTRSPYPDVEVPQISLPRIVLHRADERGAAVFTLMFSKHVQMNVADKALLYTEARRILVDGGRLAVWGIAVGDGREPDFPLPAPALLNSVAAGHGLHLYIPN